MPDALLRAADVALFRAKELGRNRFAFYRPALYDAAAQRFRLEQSLRRAVEAGDLMLMYQPQVALHTLRDHRRRGAAALAQAGRAHRHRHRIHSHRREDRTHPRAHRLGAAHGDRKRWRAGARRAGTTPASAINVSPMQFLESAFVEQVTAALEAAGLPASALELELTETVFQTGAPTIEALRRLRALGCRDRAR